MSLEFGFCERQSPLPGGAVNEQQQPVGSRQAVRGLQSARRNALFSFFFPKKRCASWFIETFKVIYSGSSNMNVVAPLQ